MPQLLQKMLDEQANVYKVSQAAYFGISLKNHFTKNAFQQGEGTRYQALSYGEKSSTEKLLLSKKWDYVILQDFTLPNIMLSNKPQLWPLEEDIKRIQLIPNLNVSEFILFRMWPTSGSYPKEFSGSKVVNTLEDEVHLINTIYDSIALTTKLSNIPITNCYLDILKNYRNINLYDGPYHPSEYGAYLNACIFFKYFTKQNATSIKYSAGLDSTVIHQIQLVVDKNLAK
jgi:hypothetical protein